MLIAVSILDDESILRLDRFDDLGLDVRSDLVRLDLLPSSSTVLRGSDTVGESDGVHGVSSLVPVDRAVEELDRALHSRQGESGA